MERQRPYHHELRDARPETLMQAQMYTPEALKPEGLAVNCHRMVSYGLAMPELMERYGDKAASLAHVLTPEHFSLILYAFAKMKHRHEGMLSAFAKHIPRRLPNFRPMSMSKLCSAYSKLRERDEGLFRRFGSEMPHKLPHFEGHQLVNVVNAYARLSIRDDLLFDDIADEVIQRPEELDASGLTLVANAFAHFRIKHPRLWPTLAEWLLQAYLDLRPLDVATVLNAFSAVDFLHDELFDVLMQYLTEPAVLSELEASSLGLALNALGRMRWAGSGHEEVLRTLGDHALQHLPMLESAGVTQLLHACTRLRPLGAHDALIEPLLARARVLVPEFGAQSLSLLVHSCAVLRRRDVPLLTLVAKAVPTHVSSFTPQALAITASGFARLEVRSEILFYLLAGEINEKMPLFSGQGVSMVLRAFGRLKIQNERLAQACRKQVRALADELTCAEVDAIEAGFRNLGALDAATEAFLRRTRREVAAAEPASAAAQRSGRSPGLDIHPGSDATDSLSMLHRLAAEAEAPARPVARTSAAEVSFAGPPAGDQLRSGGKAASPPAQSDGGPEQPDLWALWGAGDDAGAGAGRDDLGAATAPERLREYLARPERIGRRPPVNLKAGAPPKVEDAADGDELGDPTSTTGEAGVEPTRGRRRRRAQRADE